MLLKEGRLGAARARGVELVMLSVLLGCSPHPLPLCLGEQREEAERGVWGRCTHPSQCTLEGNGIPGVRAPYPGAAEGLTWGADENAGHSKASGSPWF